MAARSVLSNWQLMSTTFADFTSVLSTLNGRNGVELVSGEFEVAPDLIAIDGCQFVAVPVVREGSLLNVK